MDLCGSTLACEQVSQSSISLGQSCSDADDSLVEGYDNSQEFFQHAAHVATLAEWFGITAFKRICLDGVLSWELGSTLSLL